MIAPYPENLGAMLAHCWRGMAQNRLKMAEMVRCGMIMLHLRAPLRHTCSLKANIPWRAPLLHPASYGRPGRRRGRHAPHGRRVLAQ